MKYCPSCGEELPEPEEKPWEPQPPTKTYTFEPITVNGKEYDSITFRAPTFKEMRLAKAKAFDNNGKLLPNPEMIMSEKLACLVTGLDTMVIDRIPGHIIAEGVEYTMGFSTGPT